MPVFHEPKGPHAHLARREADRDAPQEQAPSKPEPAPPQPEWLGNSIRMSERDPKWFKRMHQLSAVSEEIWEGRGQWQIQMGSNLWPRLADASAKTSDEVWEYALTQLRGMEKMPRAICTYLAAILERYAADPPQHIKQRLVDETIPTLVPQPDRPWVVAAEARLAEKVKRALASRAGPGSDNGSVQAGRLQGLPEAQAQPRTAPQGEAADDPLAWVHGAGHRTVVQDRR